MMTKITVETLIDLEKNIDKKEELKINDLVKVHYLRHKRKDYSSNFLVRTFQEGSHKYGPQKIQDYCFYQGFIIELTQFNLILFDSGYFKYNLEFDRISSLERKVFNFEEDEAQ